MILRIAAALSLLGLLGAAAPPLAFVPQQPRFAQAAKDYRQLWRQEGARIVAALEANSGIRFPTHRIEALVRDGPPMADFEGRWLRLRASNSLDYCRATLMHELGHLLARSLPRTAELDDHRLLYLFLYDAWSDLYGPGFAERFARMERRVPGLYDYDAAWRWALAMSREQRRQRLGQVRLAAAASETIPALR
ncbi:MAG: hypothetical protein ACT4OE_07730 [Sphingosinicella sp.]